MARKLVSLSLILLVVFLTCFAYNTDTGRHARHRVSTATALIGTFFLFHTGNELDLNRLHESSEEAIPAIIHQVKLGDLTMRPAWQEARQDCLDLHPAWQFKLWQDEEANEFVQRHYPDLYGTYRQYPMEIQRSNVLRYLLLNHFGGFYLDLDLRCRTPLDLLRTQAFITPPANPTGVNNAFIASVPRHPFWSHLIANLQAYDLAWLHSPYVTNMMSTGCHFFSTMHRTSVDHASLGILDQSNKLNGHVTTALFEHLGASSWHKGDARFILRLGKMVELIKRQIILVYLALVCMTLLSIIVVVKRQRGRAKRYALVSMEEGGESDKAIM